MKSIKEKAEAYDKVLEWATEAHKVCDGMLKEDLEHLFPELKESEDEKIRLKLIEAVKGDMVVGGTKDKQLAIAWLEKQGKNNMGISEATKKKLEDNLNKALEKETAESFNEFLDEQGEQNPVDFSDLRTWKYIVDAVLTEKEGIGQYLDSPFTEEVAKKLQKRFGNIEQKPANWLQELEDKLANATPQQLAEWKEKYFKEEPAEWSEEDENILNTIINHFEIDLECTENDDIIRWLKSLRPQSTWKPSGEQMQALKDALNDAIMQYDFKGSPIKEEVTRKHAETIESLYNDLKKLMEE